MENGDLTSTRQIRGLARAYQLLKQTIRGEFPIRLAGSNQQRLAERVSEAEPAVTEFPYDPAVVLDLGIRAYEDGRKSIALEYLEKASRLHPSASAFNYLGKLAQEDGNFAHAVSLYETATRHDPTNGPIRQNFALALGAVGRFAEALDQLRLCGDAPYNRYLIAGGLTNLGRLDEADAIFRENLSIPLSATAATNTRAIRLGGSRWIARQEPLIATAPAKADFDLVYFICCDGIYFERFGAAAAASVAQNSGWRVLFHAHVVNPIPSQDLRLAGQFVVSTETVALDDRTEAYRRTFYACRRFAFLAQMLRWHGKPILCTDADQLVMRPLDRILTPEPVGAIQDPMNALNLLSYFSATAVLVRPGAERFCESLRAYLNRHIEVSDELDWHLDQAALAAVYFSERPNISRWPSSVMCQQPTPEAVFWSITASIAANDAKTRSPEFLRYAGA
jgi:tetratricopeptide (TPR) repeat protein